MERVSSENFREIWMSCTWATDISKGGQISHFCAEISFFGNPKIQDLMNHGITVDIETIVWCWNYYKLHRNFIVVSGPTALNVSKWNVLFDYWL